MNKTTYRIQAYDGDEWTYVKDGSHRIEPPNLKAAKEECLRLEMQYRRARIIKTVETTMIIKWREI